MKRCFWYELMLAGAAGSDTTAAEALKQGLKEVMSMCDHLGDVFDEAESEYYISSGR